MHTGNDTTIDFDNHDKVKNWKPPGGVYNSIFREACRDNEGRLVLKFEITSLEDQVYIYWARHGFRDKDRKKLNNLILNWLGEKEYGELISKKTLKLSDLYDRRADIEILLLDLGKTDSLRVINNIAPNGSLLPIEIKEEAVEAVDEVKEEVVWEFEI